MKATTLLGLFAFAGIALSAALEPIITRDVDGDLPPMTWTGPTKVGGEEVTLHGTVQEIYAQLTAINPQYNALDFPEYRKKVEEVAVLQGLTPEEFVNGNSTSSSSLQKRDWMNCDVAGDMVLYSGFSCKEGKDYLVRLGNGLCGAPPGPGGCARVSCSNKCGISFCNDNRFEHRVPCINFAGDYEEIARQCQRTGGGIIALKGQVFRTNNGPHWNTIVKRHEC